MNSCLSLKRQTDVRLLNSRVFIQILLPKLCHQMISLNHCQKLRFRHRYRKKQIRQFSSFFLYSSFYSTALFFSFLIADIFIWFFSCSGAEDKRDGGLHSRRWSRLAYLVCSLSEAFYRIVSWWSMISGSFFLSFSFSVKILFSGGWGERKIRIREKEI